MALPVRYQNTIDRLAEDIPRTTHANRSAPPLAVSPATNGER